MTHNVDFDDEVDVAARFGRPGTSCSRGTRSTPSPSPVVHDSAGVQLVTKSPRPTQHLQSQDLLSKCLAIQLVARDFPNT
ncbi:unnamed protein product [Notodromas monacha]|uniref:Uncharacterized protein n=1 Tax=Notodromas monacha TaxID=399045 RepID=A0A7R9BDQ3_9CRUS|nr:unnamed protein product [Notodromas monacha]CAG0913447.1 unnamed protein product [Notodromas monacha]